MFYLSAIDRSWGEKLGLAIASLCAIAFSTNSANAQITPDDTLPNNSRVITQDNLTTIEAGTTQGSNLFHSFKDFSIPTGSTAYFNNAPDIQNIISRVTGGSRSNIDGLIRAKGTANLFLLNPNGIIFGPNAQLNIGGSFLASTASSLKFADGIEFSATTPQTKALLTVSVPIGLQYGRNTGSVQVQESNLKVLPGKTLALVGGNVQIDGGQILAQGGNVELASVAAEDASIELLVNDSYLGLNFPVDVPQGDVTIANGAFVDVTAGGNGSIAITAQNLDILAGSRLLAGIAPGLGSVGSKAGNIAINATGAISINQSFISNLVQLGGVGTGGNINIMAKSLFVTNGAELIASTIGQGNAGSVNIDASEKAIFDTAGSIGFTSGVFNWVYPQAVGNGGDIKIKTGSLSLNNGAQLIVSTYGKGNAGSVEINAQDTVFFDAGSNQKYTSGLFSWVAPGSVGNGGDLNITAKSLFLNNGAQMQSFTFGQGNTGNINIQASDTVSLTGSSINGLSSSALITRVAPGAVGKGGNINLKTRFLNASKGAGLSASTYGTGDAGSMTIKADTVALDGVSSNNIPNGFYSVVFSSALGKGGDITLETRSLSLTNGAQINTSTSGQGKAGNVQIIATETGKFDGGSRYGCLNNNGCTSGIVSTAESGAVGQGGNITLTGGSFWFTNGGRLSASTGAQGNAGNVTIQADDTIFFDGVGINGIPSGAYSTVQPPAIGNGGNLNIAGRSLYLNNGALISTSTRAQGNAGNISINASDIVSLDNASSIASAVSEIGEGQGGNIKITTPILAVQDEAQVTVSSESSGKAGNLEVEAGSVSLDKTSTLTATTRLGDGGNIKLNIRDLLLLRRNSNISTSAGTAQAGGNGGNITIDSPFIVAVTSENSDITANAFSGSGGTVAINATNIFGMVVRSREDLVRLLSTNDPIQLDTQKLLTSDISAISQASPTLSGQVNINTPDVDPSRGLAELPAEVVDASGLIAQGCNAQNGKIASQFTITGRGGLPPNPSELLSSDAVWEDARRPSVMAHRQNSITATQPSDASAVVEITPATSWKFNKQGEVVLTAQAITTPQTFTSNLTTCRVP